VVCVPYIFCRGSLIAISRIFKGLWGDAWTHSVTSLGDDIKKESSQLDL